MARPDICVVVLAHNEERRIGACLASLPTSEANVEVHLVANGSTDRTVSIAGDFPGVTVHTYTQGGKSRSWNRFVLDEAPAADCYVFVDGDAEITPGSVQALAKCLSENAAVNAVSGMPCNGRLAEHYRQGMASSHGMFGDLYALRGSFVVRMRESGIRLPNDLIGDDSLIGALAKTDLEHERNWMEERIEVCPDAGFLCEPTRLSFASLRAQYGRLINYSVRHFQNRIVSEIMRGPGPSGLPERLADTYPDKLPSFNPRRHPQLWWFDRQALARMRAAS